MMFSPRILKKFMYKKTCVGLFPLCFGRHLRMCYKYLNLARQPDGVCWQNKGTQSRGDRWSWFSERTAYSLIYQDLHTARSSHARSRGIRGIGDTPAVRHTSTRHFTFETGRPPVHLSFPEWLEEGGGNDGGWALPWGWWSGLKSFNRWRTSDNNSISFFHSGTFYLLFSGLTGSSCC